jgi:outer membrane protein insertion porin family
VPGPDARVPAGDGVRLVIPQLGPLPLQIDFGFPVRRERAERQQVFSFWLGFMS